MAGTRHDAKFTPEFTAECELGHLNAADKPIDRCQAYVLGRPCPGALRRIGKGSRKARTT